MGMGYAFSQAELASGMSGNNDLFLSEVFHQASVEVNQKRPEAAAGTGAIMTGRTGHGGPQFVAAFLLHFFSSSLSCTRCSRVILLGRFASP